MKARRVALLAGGIAAASLAIPSPTPAGAAVCAKAGGLKFHRAAGKRTGKLTWKTPARGRFRVYRNGAIVGQTLGRSIRVAVKPGETYVFALRPVSKGGKVSKCTTELQQRMHFFAPFTPKEFGVRRVSKTKIKLVWARARRGDGRIGGYRVYRNGAVYRQVRKLFLGVKLTRPKAYRFAVAAADTRGHLSRLSRTISVRSRHRAPGKPAGLRVSGVTDTAVGLGWSKSKPHGARVVGYRIFRDGAPVTQAKGLAGTVANLAPATPYKFTVAAVDSQGYLSPTAGPVSVRTAMPAPTAGSAHAFLLATTDESFHDLQRHYRQVGTVYPTYFDCYGAGGATRGADDPLVTHWAQLRRIAVLPRYDCQRPETLHAILTDPQRKAATISGLVSLVQTYGYDGLNIDFEAGYASDRDALSAFCAALSQQFHALGKKVSVEVSAKWQNTTTGRSGFYDYAALGSVVDYVFVMNWGWHWTTSSPGPSDPIGNVTAVANYVSTMPNKSRFVLGMPFYGQDWVNGGGPSNTADAREYGDVVDLVARFGGSPSLEPTSNDWYYTYRDGSGSHDVWFGDAQTVSNRINVAKTRGLGVGFWRLGREDQRIWDNPQIAPGAP